MFGCYVSQGGVGDCSSPHSVRRRGGHLFSAQAALAALLNHAELDQVADPVRHLHVVSGRGLSPGSPTQDVVWRAGLKCGPVSFDDRR